MATANPNPLPLGNGVPTEALLREMNRMREEAAGRDRPILYPTEDPNMVAINIGDLLVKKPKYGIPRRFDLTEEDMAMLRSLNQARKESRKNENKDINDPNNWPADIKPYRGKAAAPPRVKHSPEEKARLVEAEREALRAKEEKSVKYYLMSPKDRIQALTARLAEARAKAVEEAAAYGYSRSQEAEEL